EISKVSLRGGDAAKLQALKVLDYALFRILKLLHPFMPFITEELAHQMGFLADDATIMNEAFPAAEITDLNDANPDVVLNDKKFKLVRAGRALRSNANIPDSKKVDFYIKAVDQTTCDFLTAELAALKLLLNANAVEVSLADYNVDANGAAPSALEDGGTIYLPLANAVDMEAEMAKLLKQKQDLEKWIATSTAKLSNEKFVAKAPAQVVAEAKEHLADLQEKLVRTEELLAAFK
ncbi:MAG: class I tRNA ligase family protein, partial [Victivallaceae bacterium]